MSNVSFHWKSTELQKLLPFRLAVLSLWWWRGCACGHFPLLHEIIRSRNRKRVALCNIWQCSLAFDLVPRRDLACLKWLQVSTVPHLALDFVTRRDLFLYDWSIIYAADWALTSKQLIPSTMPGRQHWLWLCSWSIRSVFWCHFWLFKTTYLFKMNSHKPDSY